jgi:hypothetical protein
MAMAVKLSHASMGNPSNLSVQDLVEEAVRINIPVGEYPDWLAQKFRSTYRTSKKRSVEKKPKV